MGRGGITRQMVKKAKAALIAQGFQPSIHAVRNALGNTGSNSTISRYLKELEEPPKTAFERLSEPLTLLITDISAQLQEEASEQFRKAEAQFALERDQLTSQLIEARRQIEHYQSEISELEKKLQKLSKTEKATDE